MENNDTLTVDDLRKAAKCLKEHDELEKREREKRSVKNMAQYYKAFDSLAKTLSDGEKFEMAQVLGRLAEGYYLIMPKKVKDVAMDILEPHGFPQEIYDNLIVSCSASTKNK